MMRMEMARAARQELAEAVARYDGERAGLGDEFLEEFVRTLDKLRTWPNSCARVSGRLRRCQLNRFPYGVVYQVRGDRVRVVAVAHLARRPGYWGDRE
jgi:hypothetical protein